MKSGVILLIFLDELPQPFSAGRLWRKGSLAIQVATHSSETKRKKLTGEYIPMSTMSGKNGRHA